MKRLARVLLLLAVGLALGVLLLAAAGSIMDQRAQYEARICADKGREADVLARAAVICSTEMVGCNLTHEQVASVLRARHAAEACK